MDEEKDIREEEDLLDWTPPELLARARTTAERDAQSEERKAAPKGWRSLRGRQKQSMRGIAARLLTAPPGDKPGRATRAAIGMAAVALLTHVPVFVTGPGDAHKWVFYALAALSALTQASACLRFLLPAGKDYRRSLAWTLAAPALVAPAFNAYNMASTQSSGQLLLFIPLLVLMNPFAVLLLGMLLKRHTEKLVAAIHAVLYQFCMPIAVVLLLSSLLLRDMPDMPQVTADVYVNLLLFLASCACACVLFLTWPVTARPVSREAVVRD